MGEGLLLALALSPGCGSSPRPARPPTPMPTLSLLAGVLGRQAVADGMGAKSLFVGPDSMVDDGAGNLYVTDASCLVRKIVIATAAVTTLAGHSPGGPSTDGIGTAAVFYGAHGITYDGQGNLFVSDIGTIRKVNIATAAVTTLAGTYGVEGTADGTGSAASFTELQGMTTDGSGNLFVADVYGRNIRQIVIATGVVTTLAGSGTVASVDGVGTAASFYQPFTLTYDGAGHLDVYDKGEIRQVEITDRHGHHAGRLDDDRERRRHRRRGRPRQPGRPQERREGEPVRRRQPEQRHPQGRAQHPGGDHGGRRAVTERAGARPPARRPPAPRGAGPRRRGSHLHLRRLRDPGRPLDRAPTACDALGVVTGDENLEAPREASSRARRVPANAAHVVDAA